MQRIGIIPDSFVIMDSKDGGIYMPRKKKETEVETKVETKTETKKVAKAAKTTKAAATKEKKVATKKAAAPKAEKAVKAEKVEKQDKQKYVDVINWKKGEAHAMDWLYIEVNAGDLNAEVEAGVANLKTVCDAMRECMLEGDEFITEPARKTGATLTVRYYCDNLSEDRRKYSEVNE